MISLWTALLMLAAMLVGSAFIVAVWLLAAMGVGRLLRRSGWSAEDERRRAAVRRAEDEAMERRRRDRERAGGLPFVDSSHAALRVFGWTWLASFLVVGLSSVLAHASDPGTGFPLQLALRPVWFSLAVAVMAGVAGGSAYRKRVVNLPWWKREELRRGRQVSARVSLLRRVEDLRRRMRLDA